MRNGTAEIVGFGVVATILKSILVSLALALVRAAPDTSQGPACPAPPHAKPDPPAAPAPPGPMEQEPVPSDAIGEIDPWDIVWTAGPGGRIIRV